MTIRNFPCLIDKESKRCKYIYPDFGTDFRYELIDKKLGDFKSLKSHFEYQSTFLTNLNLKNKYNIEIEFKASNFSDRSQFYSNLADAIINAFKQQKIKS